MRIVLPTIETERLVLRSLNISDADNLFDVRFHDEVIKFIKRERPDDREGMKQFINDRNEDVAHDKIRFWAITENNNNRLIGSVCLWNFNEERTIAEVGYELHPTYHGKGYMSEALKATVEFGFDQMKFNAIEAFTHKDNEASKRLLLKHAFVLDEARRDDDVPHNRIYIKTHG